MDEYQKLSYLRLLIRDSLTCGYLEFMNELNRLTLTYFNLDVLIGSIIQSNVFEIRIFLLSFKFRIAEIIAV